MNYKMLKVGEQIAARNFKISTNIEIFKKHRKIKNNIFKKCTRTIFTHGNTGCFVHKIFQPNIFKTYVSQSSNKTLYMYIFHFAMIVLKKLKNLKKKKEEYFLSFYFQIMITIVSYTHTFTMVR